MISQDMLAELRRAIIAELEENNFELVEFTHRQEGRGLVLRLLVDRPEGGITMDECAGVNRMLGQLLDERDLIPFRYILEVSSPGLDRPLKDNKDFRRCLDKEAALFLNKKISGKFELRGKIVSAGEADVSIEAAGEVLEVPYAKINKAKLIL